MTGTGTGAGTGTEGTTGKEGTTGTDTGAWAVDRTPSAEDVRLLVDRLLGADPEEERWIDPVDEGGEHATWRVGSSYVLRLAPGGAASARRRREVALRDALAVKLGVPVPRSAASGEWEWDTGLAYTLDLALPGESAERRPVPAAGERDLAALLSGLAHFPVPEAAALGVPHAAPRQVAELWTDAGQRADTRGPDAAGPDTAGSDVPGPEVPGPAASRYDMPEHGVPEHSAQPYPGSGYAAGLAALRRLETRCPATPAAEVPTALVHYDLKGEHLLLAPGGRVSGVLDWTDAVLGDPAEDIAGLALSIGAPAALRVARNAGYGPAMCARALQLVRCDTQIRLADRLSGRDDSPLPLLRAQRARAWEATPLDGAAPTSS